MGVSSGNPTYFYKKFVLTEGFTLKVSSYNRIDIGIFICFMDICLGHNGVGFEKTLYSDAGDDKELVLNAKYRLCR